MAPLYGKEREPQEEEENDDIAGHTSPKSEDKRMTESTTIADDNGSAQAPSGSKMGHFTADDASKLRKYLVLLQDCLAIKFVPSEDAHSSGAANNNGRTLQREMSKRRSAFIMGEVDHTIHGLYLYKVYESLT